MPERAAYDEAIQLARVRLKVPDDDLTYGTVEKFTVKTLAGSMERPWGIEGGFAVVYKFRTQSGKIRALRCFRVPINPDIQFRYERIGPYFAKHAPTITATFNYYRDGIVVRENVQGQLQRVTFPIIDMEWIQGVTLLEHIDELCLNRDSAGLEDLVSQWLDVLRVLHNAHISHGDLAGSNIMVRDNGTLVLVDYDSVYIPEFATAGLQQLVLGQADYQHPQMLTHPFNEYTDDFSALVIYTALLALQAKPELWDTYTQRDANILFTHADFVDPQRSLLIHELEKIHESRLSVALQALIRACQLPVEQIRFSEALADPDHNKKVALAILEQATRDDDDEHIVSAWAASLKTYAPAQVHVGRVTQAEQTLQALKRFRDALKTQQLQQISASYDASVLDTCKQVKQDERERLVLAQNFIEALHGDDDQAIVGAVDELQASAYRNALIFTQQEQQRITLAQQRKVALIKFRIAFMSKQVGDIVAAYDPVLVDSKNVTQDERELLALAHDLTQAFTRDDDRLLIESWGDIQNSRYRKSFVLNGQEQHRMDLAQARMQALQTFRVALQRQGQKKDAQHILISYNKLLDDSKSVSTQERELLREAERFMHMYDLVRDAIRMGNDKLIGAVYDEKLALQFSAFTAPEEEHIQRALKYADLEDALVHNKYGQAILLSQEIAFQSRKAVDDERLIQAKRMFIRTIDIDNIEVWLIGGELIVQWKWPLHPLVSYAMVVWRFDTWPSHPRKEDYTTYRKLSMRSSKKSDTVERIRVDPKIYRVFVQVYLAIPADESQKPVQWFYSRGETPRSRKIAILDAQGEPTFNRSLYPSQEESAFNRGPYPSQNLYPSQYLYPSQNKADELLAYRILFVVPSSHGPITIGSQLEAVLYLSFVDDNEKQETGYLLRVPHHEAIGSGLSVLLTAPGFYCSGESATSLPIEVPNERGQVTRQGAHFTLVALRPGIAKISVDLYLGSNFVTQLDSEVHVTGVGENRLLENTRITMRSRPVPQPDLVLEVQTEWNSDAQSYRFHYILNGFHEDTSPEERDYHSSLLPIGWVERSRRLLGSTLTECAGGQPEDVRVRLVSLGYMLFRSVFPLPLQQELRTLASDERLLSLLILADQDAWIPWEVLHSGQSGQGFLGEQFAIGRWLRELDDARPYEFPLGSVHIAPYANVDTPEIWTGLLSHPNLPQPLLQPIDMFSDNSIIEGMHSLHLIRYGQTSEVADMQDTPVLLAQKSEGTYVENDFQPIKLSLRQKRPLVSLGYVSRGQPELTTLEQAWAPTFIRAGSSAFVGPLWAVRPEVEAAFISSFYTRLWAGDSLSSALRVGRRIAQAVSPDSLDWLAYVLFGDPMARPYRPVQGLGYTLIEAIEPAGYEPLALGDKVRFRISLSRTPPVWHDERVIEVAEERFFKNLQAHIIASDLIVSPPSPIDMQRMPTGDYLGWFTITIPLETTRHEKLVQVYLLEDDEPIHNLMFSLTIAQQRGK